MLETNLKPNLHSPQVQEIIGSPPKRLIRNGISVIFCVVSILIAVCCFIKYPIVFTADIVISSEYSTSIARADSSVIINRICMTNDKTLSQNKLIVWPQKDSSTYGLLCTKIKNNSLSSTSRYPDVSDQQEHTAHPMFPDRLLLFHGGQLCSENNRIIIGKTQLSPQRAKNIYVGQIVKIKLDDYPCKEYGILKAPIKNILPMTEGGKSDINQSKYTIAFIFPKKIVSTSGKDVVVLPQMTGSVEFTTYLHLIDLITDPIKSLFDK